MNQFLLRHQQSKELELFPHLLELAIRKNTTIQLNSLNSTISDSIRIYYVLEGKFEWVIQDRHSILYPGDLAIILPQQTFRGEKDCLDIGTLFWIHIHIERMENDKRIVLGNWSGLSESESRTIGRVLHINNTSVLVKMKDAHIILQTTQTELFQQTLPIYTLVVLPEFCG